MTSAAPGIRATAWLRAGSQSAARSGTLPAISSARDDVARSSRRRSRLSQTRPGASIRVIGSASVEPPSGHRAPL